MTVDGSALDPATTRLIQLAASIALGQEADLRERMQMAVHSKVPPLWVDELLLQSALVTGWPRALSAAALWRKAVGTPATGGDEGTDYSAWELWQQRGEQSCREVYGESYDRLRESIRQFHPALEAGMIMEAYGRTISRPGLDLKRRELCTVVQTAVLNTPRQLHSHLRGSLNAGASLAEIEATLGLVRHFLSLDDWNAVQDRWQHIRDRWTPSQ